MRWSLTETAHQWCLRCTSAPLWWELKAISMAWKGLLCLGGGIVFHFLRGSCERDTEALAGAVKISKLNVLGKYAEGQGKEDQGLVAVVGMVNADTPFPCRTGGRKAVICEESVECFPLNLPIRSKWAKDSTFVRRSRQEVSWYLEDSSDRVYVNGAHNASGFELLLAREGIQEPVFSIDEIPIILYLFYQGVGVHCSRRTERTLPVGTVLTVVGEVSRGDNDKLVLQRPKGGGPFFVSTKCVDCLLGRSRWCKWLSWGCTAAGVLSLVTSAMELLERRQRPCPRGSQHPNQSRAGVQRAGQGQHASSDRSCVICLEKEYNIAFFPCGHVCCCNECVESLTSCPLCRERISQKKAVHLH